MLGVDSETNATVAIKILHKAKIYDIEDVERISREIFILKKIENRFVIKLYEIIETNY